MMRTENAKSKRYVTVLEAVELLHTSERTVRRMIAQDRLHTIQDRTGHRLIDLDDIEQELEAKPRVISPLQHRLACLLTTIEQMQAEHKHYREQSDARYEHLVAEHEQLQAKYEQLEAIVKEQQLGRWDQASRREVIDVVTGIVLPTRGIAGAVLRRGLPEGSMRLVAFAEQHHLNIHHVKQAHYQGQMELTVYLRQGEAKRNRQEWWVTPEQHQQIIAACEQLALPYVACPQCVPSPDTEDK